jgi:hypothetical protein
MLLFLAVDIVLYGRDQSKVCFLRHCVTLVFTDTVRSSYGEFPDDDYAARTV